MLGVKTNVSLIYRAALVFFLLPQLVFNVLK